MKKFYLVGILMFTAILYSCRREATDLTADSALLSVIKSHSKTGELDFYIMPSSTDYSALPNQDPKNPVTDIKVRLGKMLFFETGIGLGTKHAESIATYSCSSCHVPERGFTPGRFQGLGDGGSGYGNTGEARVKRDNYGSYDVDAQGARPLAMLNLTYVRNALWNGSFGSYGLNKGTEAVWGITDTLTSINKEGYEGLEANNHRALVTHRQVINKNVLDKLGYTSWFDQAFPEIPVDQRYTLQIAGNAIAAYFRTILTNEAPFQKWLNGNSEAMTIQQKRGAELFFGKAGCVNCHNSPSLNNQRFAAVGVYNLYQNSQEAYNTDAHDARNKGRGGFTLKEEDLYKFKVPQLYNLKDFGFYFHGASKTSIKDVVKYFNAGIPENPEVPLNRIDPLFKPIGLSDSQIDDLVEFITNGLYDPNLLRYKPYSVLSGNCFPNNDPQSKKDMGCN